MGTIPTLTASDEMLLGYLARYHYLTAEQACRLLFSIGSLEYARTRCKRLVDLGYLTRLRLPKTQLGNTPYLYTLARKGLNVLSAAGIVTNHRFRSAEEHERSYLFLTHTLRVNDVLIGLELVRRQRPDISVEVQHERDLRHSPVKVAYRRWAQRQIKEETTAVIPDATIHVVSFAHEKRQERVLLLDLDMGTIEQAAMKKKLHALMAYAEQAHQQIFATQALTFLFVTTAGEHRAEKLKTWCEEAIAQAVRDGQFPVSQKPAYAAIFWFTALSPGAVDGRCFLTQPIWRWPFRGERAALLQLG